MTWTTPRAEPANRKKIGPIAWREAGHGPPVLLIHGVGLNADAWEPQIATLSSRRRVIAIDMPGHGKSDLLPDGVGLGDFVAEIAGFIDAMGLSPVPVVGHSMGALIALGLALDYPEKVAAVVALNAVFCRDPVARSAVESRAAQLTGGAFEVTGPVTRWFPNDPNGPLARCTADRASKASSRPTGMTGPSPRSPGQTSPFSRPTGRSSRSTRDHVDDRPRRT